MLRCKFTYIHFTLFRDSALKMKTMNLSALTYKFRSSHTKSFIEMLRLHKSCFKEPNSFAKT